MLGALRAAMAAVVVPPRFFGLADQGGTIATGGRANLVLVAGNPLDGLGVLRRPVAVIAGGRLHGRATLDAIEADLLDSGRNDS
jgi:imidazolonepropionase-like amidohydrolase